MPELPEVEVIRLDLLPLQGKTISSTTAADERIFNPPLIPEKMETLLNGKTLTALDRYGKYLFIGINDNWLIYHPRMSGKVFLNSNPPPGPDKVKLKLQFDSSTDENLYLTSLRRFSQFYWHEDKNPRQFGKIKKLGPDPFKKNYTWENFKAGLKNRRGAIKTLLLNQDFLAGLGNIYASEACYRAKIDPRKKVPRVKKSELKFLFQVIPKLLREAILARGSSLSSESSATSYRDAKGKHGYFHEYHRVYGREGEYCLDCSSQIQKIEQAGRSSYYCPICQQ